MQESIFRHSHYLVRRKVFTIAGAILLGAIEGRQN